MLSDSVWALAAGFARSPRRREHIAVGSGVMMITLGAAFLPTLLAALSESRVIGWIVFALGILTVVLAMLLGYQYGIRSGAGYIALTIAVFVLLPAGFALVNTFRWARAN